MKSQKKEKKRTAFPSLAETRHILDTSYRFSLVHKVTKSRKENDRLKGNEDVLLDFSLNAPSLFSLVFFLKLSLFSSLHCSLFLALSEKRGLKEKKTSLSLLSSFGIKNDRIFFLEKGKGKHSEKLLSLALEKKIGYLVLNDYKEDFLLSFFSSFLGKGKIESLLPKERVKGITLLRPFQYVSVFDVDKFLTAASLPFKEKKYSPNKEKNLELLSSLDRTYSPFARQNVRKARTNVYKDKVLGYIKGGKKFSFLTSYREKGEEKDLLIKQEGLEEKALKKAQREHKPLKCDKDI